ncbi:glycine--tRNA ligase subunit beta [Selenihalanaerobacter shriftii]|uniref:Glycine--tRNA ligase beta subunit n=1 Tax=Selenihalanaerobacter shriftii TaxID=142842 RepID=A0A1T4MXY4_9FIRM|nr:glycine--tRNA ligase subunit beta [Selenihalanaerobacter shriftii]SJZ71518.1 glycyl-tRNA synthetase beta chain [Selenihalanaerobacter shriftii]
MSKEKLLLEIGTEEIPAGFMQPIFDQLEKLAAELFKHYRIDIDSIDTYGTPRRLTLLLEGVNKEQKDLTKEVKGPAKNIAFDDEGNPTKAGEGFARGQGLAVDELEVRNTENGEYLFAVQKEEGKRTIELLSELLNKLIKDLSFPKAMRWADKDLSFVRPIQWILALYGEEVVDLEIADVKADRYTRGHRFLSEGEIEIDSVDDYFDKLNDEYVIVNQNKRKEMVIEQINKLADEVQGEVLIDKGLLTEVIYLVEYPTGLMGSFDAEFLELPREVLITSMREHQRYFPVEGKDGNLMPRFITVRNGSKDYIDIVKEGNEKVLRARLADGKFFYDEDQKEDLEVKIEELKDIIFQEDLGTIYEKVERIVELTERFSKVLNLDEDQVEINKRAAYLSKADLVTEMVTEFSKLQGVMGREYAKLSGEDEVVAEAIFEHYLPRHATDILPESTTGQLVSIADKIDNIVGCFGVGLIPTGSQDPYALRRQAQGIVRIILETELNLNLDELVENALTLLDDNNKLKRDADEVKEEVMGFFKQRLEWFMNKQDIRYDVRDAILATEFADIKDAFERAEALMEFREKEKFENLISAYNRARNLAVKTNNDQIDLELFTDSSEEELYNAYLTVQEKLQQLLNEKNYVSALHELVKLQEPIDKFFNSVMVMADDETVKENRLALLKNIVNIFTKVADLSEIVID